MASARIMRRAVGVVIQAVSSRVQPGEFRRPPEPQLTGGERELQRRPVPTRGGPGTLDAEHRIVSRSRCSCGETPVVVTSCTLPDRASGLFITKGSAGPGPPRTGRPRRRPRRSAIRVRRHGDPGQQVAPLTTSRDRPRPSDPTTSTSGPSAASRSPTGVVPAASRPIRTGPPAGRRRGRGSRLARLGDRHPGQRPGRRLPRPRGHPGRAARGDQHPVPAEHGDRAGHRTKIAEIGWHPCQGHDQRARGPVSPARAVRSSAAA